MSLYIPIDNSLGIGNIILNVVEVDKALKLTSNVISNLSLKIVLQQNILSMGIVAHDDQYKEWNQYQPGYNCAMEQRVLHEQRK